MRSAHRGDTGTRARRAPAAHGEWARRSPPPTAWVRHGVGTLRRRRVPTLVTGHGTTRGRKSFGPATPARGDNRSITGHSGRSRRRGPRGDTTAPASAGERGPPLRRELPLYHAVSR